MRKPRHTASSSHAWPARDALQVVGRPRMPGGWEVAPFTCTALLSARSVALARGGARLGRRLSLESMDPRKPVGQTAGNLEPWFDALPEARLCLDVAHAQAVDPSLEVGHELLARYSSRLSPVHLSSLDAQHHHVPLTDEDIARSARLLARCGDVPWILEAPLNEKTRRAASNRLAHAAGRRLHISTRRVPRPRGRSLACVTHSRARRRPKPCRPACSAPGHAPS